MPFKKAIQVFTSLLFFISSIFLLLVLTAIPLSNYWCFSFHVLLNSGC